MVSLVGAGPGDPDLLTLAAVRRIASADVIVHDHLVDERVLQHARPEAQVVYAGKESGAHSVPQPEINAILASHALAGRHVVRLKGGDPFIFGRGGEEMHYLLERGVPCEVVPGVTSAGGAAAASGIPLTHRDCAQGLTFITGHARAEGPEPDWSTLARPRHTVVVYMGLAAAERIADALIAAGRDPQTPAAAIERATQPGQRVVTATLATLATSVRTAGLRSPTLLVIGEVVAIRGRVGVGGRGSVRA